MATATPDPTLATLIPEPSARRNVAFAALTVALLVAAWFALPLLHPGLRQDASGSLGGFKDSPISMYRVTAAGPLTVEGVRGTGPAEVVGAWIVPDKDGWVDLADSYSPDGSPEDLLRASGIDPDAAALPHTLANGETVWLVVAWRITGCPVVDMASWGDITVRSPLGIERRQELGGGGPLYPTDTVQTATCP